MSSQPQPQAQPQAPQPQAQPQAEAPKPILCDDPRLSQLISNNPCSQIILAGCPYDILRKRSINKGGQDNGPCCLRRFYAKVGPLFNPQFGIDISGLTVADLGNFVSQCADHCQQKFSHVQSKRFKGEFVNYWRESPEVIVEEVAKQLAHYLSNNQTTVLFGGSKEALVANVEAFHLALPENKPKSVFILSAKALLDRPYDGNKYTCQNILTILQQKHPQTNFHILGYQKKYTPPQQSPILLNPPKGLHFTSYPQLRNHPIPVPLKHGLRTSALHKLISQFPTTTTTSIQINICMDVLELFMGCRDVEVQGILFQELLEIMMWVGAKDNVVSVGFCQFNPSCEDYESSLVILNALYYFLMGRATIQPSKS